VKTAALGCVSECGAVAARSSGVAAAVAALLRDPDDDVRAAAANGLGRLLSERSDAM
jgi:hypothetical protein